MSEEIVLDSFALLSFFHRESGWQKVQKILYDLSASNQKAILNIINLGEFYYIIKRRVGKEKSLEALGLIKQLPIEIYPVDEPLVIAAGDIKAEHTISYADAFCVATAKRFDAKIITNDPEFNEVKHIVQVVLL